MVFALTLAVTGVQATAVCTDHNPIIAAIAEKMKLPSEFRTCDSVSMFCDEKMKVISHLLSLTYIMTSFFKVNKKVDLTALDVDIDKQTMDQLTADVKKLEDEDNVTAGALISLACPVTCNTCTSRALAASDDPSSLRGNERRLSPIYACGCNCNCVGSKIKCKAAKSRIPACSTFAKYRGQTCSKGMSQINMEARKHGIQLKRCSGTVQ